MDAERWQRLSPLLDAMFELDPESRVRNLGLLREQDPQLAEDLEALLALEKERADFLAEPLLAALPGARPGTMIGPYQLERMLGEGGMGQVWLAGRADGLHQRRVALKLLRPGLADPYLRLRFTRERQILARLEHPHIARLLDAGITSDGQPYLALEYVEGEPITDWCSARALTMDERLRLFLQICDAVSHAHANLIVHRDLKPSNILVTPLHEVRLLDFGIAKLLDTTELGHEHTGTGLRTFTLHYAAPEQIRGEPVTTRTDVYTLGVVLYELLTDSKPYRLKRQSDAEWEEAILATDPLRPSLTLQRGIDGNAARVPDWRRRARELTGDLDNIVLKTLAKHPEQRYPSVEALALDLQYFRDGKPVWARPQNIGYRVRKYVHRHRWALATGVLVTMVLSTALGIVTWQARQAVAEASRAQAMQDFVIGLFEQTGTTPGDVPLDVRQLLDAGVLLAALRTPAALAALDEARRVRVAQAGTEDALIGDIERLTGEVLSASGRHAEARAHLQQAVRLTRAGYGPQHMQTRLAELAQARLWAVEGRVDAAQTRFDAIAALKGIDPKINALRWRARAYAGEAGCRDDTRELARIELEVLIAELRASLSEGSSLSREISAIHAACS